MSETEADFHFHADLNDRALHNSTLVPELSVLVEILAVRMYWPSESSVHSELFALNYLVVRVPAAAQHSCFTTVLMFWSCGYLVQNRLARLIGERKPHSYVGLVCTLGTL